MRIHSATRQRPPTALRDARDRRTSKQDLSLLWSQRFGILPPMLQLKHHCLGVWPLRNNVKNMEHLLEPNVTFSLYTSVICYCVTTALAYTSAGLLSLKQNGVFTFVITSGCTDCTPRTLTPHREQGWATEGQRGATGVREGNGRWAVHIARHARVSAYQGRTFELFSANSS